MAEKTDKIILEREYIVPLRKGAMKTVYYKRASKAIKVLKQFIAKHMKVVDRDLRKVKLDRYVNEEMWFRGIRKPLAKIKVKAKKFESGIVKVELAEIPQIVRFRMDKEKKRTEEKIEKKPEEKPKEEKTAEAKAEEKKESDEKKEEQKDKKEAVVESGMKHAAETHREAKHASMEKKGIKKPLARKALKK